MAESPEINSGPHEVALGEMLAAANIEASPQQVEMLDRYRQLLWSWNERINLTRHTTVEKFVTRDVIDSVELAKLLKQGERVLDVGTGGGVPGVILAILRPDLRLSLCESTAKKAKAVEAMVGELELDLPVYACRAEDVLQAESFDTLVARAVAPLGKVLFWLRPHWDSFDRLLLIKGRSWVEERAEARQDGRLRGLALRKAATYQTPRTDAESVILKLYPSDAPDADS